MFGVSLPELVLLMVVILVVFGPDKLPDAARTLGKFMAGVKKNTDAVRREFYNSIHTPAGDFRSELSKAKRELTSISNELDAPELMLHPDCPDTERRLAEIKAKREAEAAAKAAEQTTTPSATKPE